jgi:predicted PhzF superfamily epimerase YddE/YHI9
MRIPLYQIDAFADGPFTGNPAAVCPLEEWLPDDVMQAIAAENNLSETAFFVPEGDGYRLRWFTPTTEVDLCGHATLASALVVFRWLMPQRSEVTFQTQQAGPSRATAICWRSTSRPGRPPLVRCRTASPRRLGGLRPRYWRRAITSRCTKPLTTSGR